MKINAEAIKELADLLNETGLNEIEVVDGEQSIRVNKGGTMIASAAPVAAAPVAMASDPAIPQKASLDAPAAQPSSHPGAVKSPMVGTVYTQPEPDAPVFAKKGDSVNKGDTLVIIEAMKVMNPIKAETSGTVTQVLIENGQPVEFGDVLMIIE